MSVRKLIAVPLIWVLTGAKTGDNAQVLRAATAMGLPFEVKRIALRPEFETAKPKVVPSLHIIDRARSAPLAGPWPDLVITIGRRLSLVALWIKQQSGGRSRIALFNAPKGRAQDFDLIVVPAYYTIADGPRVCRIGLPLIAADEQRIAAASQAFAGPFSELARPLHVLLLGGDMGARKLHPAFAETTLRTMQQGFARDGMIYVSTSRRTPDAAADAVQRMLRPQDRLYRWRGGAADNPYFALLAHGNSFTVTSDSLSMLTEVARLGKPLAIAEPPEQASAARFLRRFLPLRGARDLNEAAAYLIRGGYAARLGMAFPPALAPPPDDTAETARRLRQIALGRD
jgi:mitochondrial fission protein ELM1